MHHPVSIHSQSTTFQIHYTTENLQFQQVIIMLNKSKTYAVFILVTLEFKALVNNH